MCSTKPIEVRQAIIDSARPCLLSGFTAQPVALTANMRHLNRPMRFNLQSYLQLHLKSLYHSLDKKVNYFFHPTQRPRDRATSDALGKTRPLPPLLVAACSISG